MKTLTKQQQSARANRRVNDITAKHPTWTAARVDNQAVFRLQLERPTLPWEYPWAEVVRWCRDQRR